MKIRGLFGLLTVFLVSGAIGVEVARPQASGFPGPLGVIVHYLPAGPYFAGRISAFDVDNFVNDAIRANVAYVVFPIGQNSGYYNAPNTKLANSCKIAAARQPSIDLPLKIGTRLKGTGIRLILYVPFHGPKFDIGLKECLGDGDEYLPPSPFFLKLWSEVLGEWAERYSEVAVGFWIDGAYNTEGMGSGTDSSKPPWEVMCNALQQGSIRWLAFNPGTSPNLAFSKIGPCQNFTAGEQNTLPPLSSFDSMRDNIVPHVMTYLGLGWAGRQEPRLNPESLAEYIRALSKRHGALTLDVAVNDDGHIFLRHLEFLVKLNKALEQQSDTTEK